MSASHDVLPNSSNFLSQLEVYNLYLARLKSFQCQDQPDLYKTFDSIPTDKLLDYNIKMKFLKLLGALSALENTRTSLESRLFYDERCEIIFRAIKLADDLAKPEVINQKEKIGALAATIQQTDAWVRKGFRVKHSSDLVQATQEMEKVFLSSAAAPETCDSFFRFNKAVFGLVMGGIFFTAGMVLYLMVSVTSPLVAPSLLLQLTGMFVFIFSTSEDDSHSPGASVFSTASEIMTNTRDVLKKFSIFTYSAPQELPVEENTAISDNCLMVPVM